MRGHYLLGAASALAIMAGISHSTPARAASGSTYMPAVGCTGYMYGNSISNPLNCVTQIPGAGLAPGAAATNLGFTPARVFNVTDPKYGAICNGNSSNAAADTAGINAAVAAAAAAGGGVVALPPGNCYTNATITVAVSSVQIWGQGENSTTVTPTGAFDAFDFGYLANATNSHVGLRDLSIIWTSTPTSGYCFGVDHTYYPEVHNIFCQNSYAGVAIGPSYFGEYDNVRFLSSYTGGSHGDGLKIYGDQNTIGSGTHPVSNNFNDWYFLSPVGGAFEHDLGISSAEHTYFKNIYFNGANTNNVLMQVQDPSTATSPGIQNTTFETIYSDNNASNMGCGIYINGNANGTIVDTKISNLIAAGEVPFVNSGSTQGVCVNSTTPSQVADLKIVNANIYDWQATGLNIQSGTDIQLTNVKTQNNNALNTLSAVGLDIGPNVSGLIATNLRAGGSTYGTTYQLYGVYLESGAQHIVIDGGDVTGNVLLGVDNLTLASQATVKNVLGYDIVGATCDAQVVYGNLTTSGGSGGKRTVTIAGTPAAIPVAGQLIDVGLGGSGAGVSWQGTVVSTTASPNPVITVTAAAGTATGPTYGVVQWGTDTTSAFTYALASAPPSLTVPGQCGIASRVTMSASGVELRGKLGPPGHHDAIVTPWSPPPFSGFVWLGSPDIMFNQTSVSGLSNKQTKGQSVRNLAFFGGNSATVGRNIATVSGSTAYDLYAADATSANFVWGLNGASALGEAAGTCFLDEANFTADGVLYGALDYLFSGQSVTLPSGASNWDYCASNFRNVAAFFGGADAIEDVFADHNHIDNVTMIGNGAGTTAYSIHATSITAGPAQANHYTRITVSNLTTNTQGQIKVEGNATDESFEWLDNLDPPVGWSLIIANSNPITCTNDHGEDCAPVAIASLPTCNAGLVNKRYTVNNGVASPTYNAAVSTTGSATDAVMCATTNGGSSYGWVYR